MRRAIHARFRILSLILLFNAVWTSAAQSMTTGGIDRPKLEAILVRQCVMTGADFQTLVQGMELEAPSLQHAYLQFNLYEETIDRIAHDVLKDLAKHELDEIYVGNQIENWPSLTSFLAAREEARERIYGSRHHFGEELDRLLEAVEAHLIPRQQAIWRASVCTWKRSQLFNLDGQSSPWIDLWHHVDLINLFRFASAPDGELSELFDPEYPEHDLPKAELARINILAALYEYEFALEQECRISHRQQRLVDESIDGLYAGDTARIERCHDLRMTSWRRIYAAGLTAAQRIATEAETAVGPATGRAWMDRFYKGYYPLTEHPVSCELMYQWMVEELELNTEIRASLQAIYDAFDSAILSGPPRP